MVTEKTQLKNIKLHFHNVLYVLLVFSNSIFERTKAIKTSNWGSGQDGRLCCCPQARCWRVLSVTPETTLCTGIGRPEPRVQSSDHVSCCTRAQGKPWGPERLAAHTQSCSFLVTYCSGPTSTLIRMLYFLAHLVALAWDIVYCFSFTRTKMHPSNCLHSAHKGFRLTGRD